MRPPSAFLLTVVIPEFYGAVVHAMDVGGTAEPTPWRISNLAPAQAILAYCFDGDPAHLHRQPLAIAVLQYVAQMSVLDLEPLLESLDGWPSVALSMVSTWDNREAMLRKLAIDVSNAVRAELVKIGHLPEASCA